MKKRKEYRPNRTRKQLAVAVFLAVVCVGLVQWFSGKNVGELNKAVDDHLAGHRLSEMIDAFGDSVIVSNDNLKVYAQWADAAELHRHQLSIVHLQHQLKEIDQLAGDDIYHDDLDLLHKLTDEKIAQDRSVELMRMSGMGVSQQELDQGDALTQKLSDAANNMLQKHQKILLQRLNESREFSVKISLLDAAATTTAILIIVFASILLFRDISKRNRLEQELREATAKAEQSALLKEQFMANMSHEIRTPLNAVLGFTELLARTKLDGHQENHLSAIRQSGQNLMHIINDILDFSRLEAGMMPVEEIPFNVQDIFHTVNTMFQSRAAEKGIQLRFHPLENVPEMVSGDPTRLTQVFVNLVGNALKFTQHGEVDIRGKMLRGENDKIMLSFSVSDTGIGIAPDRLEDIFERFNQAENDTSRKYGGTGLGLSIVKRLLQLQGGMISVASEPGKGTTFSFTIPYKKAFSEKNKFGENGNVFPENFRQLTGNIRVLVAEDNPLNQRLAAELLRANGIDCEIAADGEIVIQKLRDAHFDLVLMDIQMPGQNGYDISRRIRNELKSAIPIIAVTAHALAGEREKCISAGMNDYISKPLNPDSLLLLIARHVAKRKSNMLKAVYRQPQQSERITNLDYLRQLANGNEAFIREMISLFLSENPEELRLLDEAIAKGNFGVIAEVAHKMRSTIPFVGIGEILDQPLGIIEAEAAVKGNLELIRENFSEVESVCRKAADELNAA